MAAGQGNTRVAAGLAPAFDHPLAGGGVQLVNGPGEDGDGHQRSAAHGVDVADGVGGGNLTELERVIHNGHEKVGGGQHRRTIAQIEGGGIVLGVVAHQQFIRHAVGHAGLEHLFQQRRGDLAATACAVGVFGQSDHVHAPHYKGWHSGQKKVPRCPSVMRSMAVPQV